MAGANMKYKDRVFRMIFGYEKYKENLLELFNALNDTNYTNPDDLEINTLDDVFYMKMKNDVSCIIDNRIAVYNINDGHNKELMNKCKILQEYATMVAKIREFRQKGCDLDMAIEETIEYCLLHDVLKEFLLEHKSEVADMLRMEYDEARTMNHLKEDYYEEGVKDGEMKTKVSLICRKLIKGMSQSDIAELLEEDTSYVKKICDEIGDNPSECDVDEVVRKLSKIE